MAVILPQSIQSDLQSSLPIIPNNGNPGGAYNMAPSQEDRVPQAPIDPYAWLKPSAYMDKVKQILEQQDALLEETVFNIRNPQSSELFNLVPGAEGIHIQPINDYRIPIGYSEEDTTPMTYPLDLGLSESPQYRPILPGE